MTIKQYASTLTLFASLMVSTGAWAAEKTVTLNVDNMTCELCPITVKESLAKVPGVTNVDVSLEAKTAIVTFDDAKTTTDSLMGATTNAGYPSHLAK
jgi:mercuric ion binding protein